MTGMRLALLVAADQFADPQLSALQAPQADIDALSELLTDREIGGFTVERLVNCTSQELRLSLHKLLSRREPDDFCLFHVSSHGLKDASGELYLATSDTQREYLEATSVEASYLRRQMDHSRAGAIVVLLDCCYGGAFERGTVARADSQVDLSGALVPTTEGRGRAVITASTAIEYAFEGSTMLPGAKPAPSVFTEAVVAGIRQGSADPSRSTGVLTLSELFTFVSRRVRLHSANQTPQWWLYGMSGDLVIARNPNPIVVAKDLPDDVVEVLQFPQPAARLGAVLALRTMVREGDPGAALGAYRMLETLAMDDSRQVSMAAADALDGVQVTVAPQMIDFGTVPIGHQAARPTLELAGTLAPACQVTAHDAPIELVRRAARVEVRLDTSTAADVNGRIEVIGPGGGATIPVRAKIIGAPDSTGVSARDDPKVQAAASAATQSSPQAIDDETARTNADERANSPVRLRRERGLLIALWAATVGTLLAGFVNGNYSGDNWFEHLTPNLSLLSVIATPVAMVGLQLSRRSRRGQMAAALATAGTGFLPAGLAIGLMAYVDGPRQELMIELVGAISITVLAAILAAGAGRQVEAEPARTNTVTTVLLGVIAAVAAVLIWVVNEKAADSEVLPLLIGICVVWALLALGLLLPLRSRRRVALGAFGVGLLGTVALYTFTPDPPEANVAALGSLLIGVTVIFHVRPFWQALHDKDPRT